MIAGMRPVLTEETYVFAGPIGQQAAGALTPHAICTFHEAEGLSLILPLDVAARHSLDVSLPMRCITLSVQSALNGVGLTAAVGGALAEAGIAANIVAAFHHDHAFVPAAQAQTALELLQARAAAETGKIDGAALVRRYFAAVDAADLDGVLATLHDDCVFTVETHGVRLEGREAISGMFRRLWANHRAVRHYEFRVLAAPGWNRIAAQFQVENTEKDGSLTHKSNCNFFDFRDGRFSHIAVYMAGPNTLDHNRAP